MEKTVDRHITVRYRTQEKHRRFYFLKQLTSNEITSATTLWYSHILRIMQPLLENNFHGNTPVLSVCCQCAFKKSRTWDLNTDFCVTLHHSASLTAVFWEFKTQSLHGFNSLLNFIPDIHPSALYPPTPPTPPLFLGINFIPHSPFPPLCFFLSFGRTLAHIIVFCFRLYLRVQSSREPVFSANLRTWMCVHAHSLICMWLFVICKQAELSVIASLI